MLCSCGLGAAPNSGQGNGISGSKRSRANEHSTEASGKARADMYPPVGPACGSKVSNSTIRCLNKHLLRMERNSRTSGTAVRPRVSPNSAKTPTAGRYRYLWPDFAGQTPFFSTALDLRLREQSNDVGYDLDVLTTPNLDAQSRPSPFNSQNHNSLGRSPIGTEPASPRDRRNLDRRFAVRRRLYRSASRSIPTSTA